MQTIFSSRRRFLRSPFYVLVRQLVRERDPGPYRYAVYTSRNESDRHQQDERIASLHWLGVHGRTVYRVNVRPKWWRDKSG